MYASNAVRSASQPVNTYLGNLATGAALTNLNGAQPTNATLTIQAAVDLAMIPAITNMAYASSLTAYGNRRWSGSVSNAMTGNLNLLVTNINEGGGFALDFTADGSARTVSLFFPAGYTIRYRTNSSIVGTNLALGAGETHSLAGWSPQTNLLDIVAGKVQ